MESVIYRVPWLIESFDCENVIRIRDICHLNCLQFHSQVDDFIGCVHCMKRLIREGIIRGYEDLIQILFDLGVNFKIPVREYDVCCSNALHIACEYGQLTIVNFLLLNIDDVSFRTSAVKRFDGTTYENAFSFAARTGHVEIVKCLQDIGSMNINENLPDGGTALSALAFENNYEATKILCECGADVNLGSFDGGFKAIHYASQRQGSSEMLRLLLKYGANIEEPLYGHKYGERPLFLAVKNKCEENIKILLEVGANVFGKGKLFEEHTHLIGSFCLSAIKCPALIPEFLKHGADPNEVYDENGDSVFVIAMDHGSTNEVLEKLISAGTQKGRRGKTALQSCRTFDQIILFHKAGWTWKEIETDFSRSLLNFVFEISGMIEQEMNELFLNLLPSGVNPNLVLEGEDSPLIKATKKGWRLVVETLLKFGSNVNHTGIDGNTAVHICCMKDCKSNDLCYILKLLIEEGANLNIANKYMEFPLEVSLKRLNMDFPNSSNTAAKLCISLMLNNGADPNLTIEGRDSPLILAIRQDEGHIVEILLDARANILHKGVDGATAFDECLKNCHPNRNNVMRMLIDKGLPLNVRHPSGKYPFELMIQNNFDKALFLLMLSKGTNPNIIHDGADSFLMTAIKRRQFDLAIALIDSGADYNYKNTEGWRAFDFFLSLSTEISVERCNEEINIKYPGSSIEVFTRLLTFEKEANQKSISGIYPIEIAVKLGSEYLVKQLIKDGADVNVMKDSLDTPLTIALYNDFEDIVVLLLESNADVNHLGGERKLNSYPKGGSFAKYRKSSRNSRVINDNSTVFCFGDSILTRVIRDMRHLSDRSMKNYISLLLRFDADPNIVDTGHESPLMHAIRLRKFDIALMLVEGGADVKFQGSRGLTPLHVCLGLIDRKEPCTVQSHIYDSNEIHNMLQTLLNSGASPSTLSDNLLTPLHMALQIKCCDRTSILLQLLDYTKDINVTDAFGYSPLIVAAAKQFCDFEVIEKMISVGADTTLKASDGITFLHIFMGRNEIDTDITSYIVKHGADINAEDDRGETPLSVFIRTQKSPDVQHLRFLIEEMGSDPNSRIAGGDTVLMHAVQNRRYAVADCLIQAGAIVNLHGNGGINALHLAVGLCVEEQTCHSTSTSYQPLISTPDHEKCVSSLLEAAACVNDETFEGKTPLSILLSCVKYRNTVKKIFNLLIAADANPNCGRPVPLLSAVKFGDISMIECLLNRGAEINQIDDYGENALTTLLNPDWFNSTEEFLYPLTQVLLEHGADVNFKNRFGRTPLVQFFYSIEPFLYDQQFLELKQTQLTTVVSVLLQYGSDPNTIPKGIDSVLMKAIEIDNLEMVKDLLTYNANINHHGAEGKTVIHKYFGNRIVEGQSKVRDIGILAELLNQNVKLSPEEEFDVLVMAINQQNVLGVKMLLKARATLLHSGIVWSNAMDICMQSYFGSSLEIIDILLDYAKDGAVPSFFEQFWHFIQDKYIGNKDLLEEIMSKVLLHRGINFNLSERMAISPLIFFCKLGIVSVVEKMLENNADVNHVDTYGMTALHYVCDIADGSVSIRMLECLLKKCPRLDTLDCNGHTALQRILKVLKNCPSSTCSLDNFETFQTHFRGTSLLMQRLLEEDINPECDDLTECLLVLAENGDFKGMKSLLRKGANVSVRDDGGNTIVHLCWSQSSDGSLDFIPMYVNYNGPVVTNNAGQLPLMSLLKTGETTHGETSFEDSVTAKLVPYLVQNEGMVNCVDENLNTPIILSARKGYAETIQVLLNLGANPCHVNKDKDSVFHVCLNYYQDNIVQVISKLTSVGNVGPALSLNNENTTPLYLATRIALEKASSTLCKILLEHGANPNIHSLDCIPLISAVKEFDADTVGYLLKGGASVNVVDENGRSSLHNILSLHNDSDTKEELLPIVNLLLEYRIDVNVTDCEGRSALSYVFSTQMPPHWHITPRVNKTQRDVVLKIIEHVSDVNLIDVKGESLLSRFCRSDNDAIIGNALLKAGADPNVAFCLENAVRNQQCKKENESWLAFISLLIEVGANPNSYKKGTPILARIIKKRCVCLVEDMIRKGADVNASDESEKSILHYACSMVRSEEREQVVRLIVKHGAKLNKTTDNGTTPLDLLIESVTEEMQTSKVKKTKISKTHYISIDMSLLNFFVSCGASLSCQSYRWFVESQLLQLLRHGFISTVIYLIQSGWNTEREDWLKKDLFQISLRNIFTTEDVYQINIKHKVDNFTNFVKTLGRGPKSLEFLCRNCIRNHLLSISNGTEINSLIHRLPLPSRLISFLACYDFQQQREIIDLKRRDLDSDDSDGEDSSDDSVSEIATDEEYNDDSSEISSVVMNSDMDEDMHDDDSSDFFFSGSDSDSSHEGSNNFLIF